MARKIQTYHSSTNLKWYQNLLGKVLLFTGKNAKPYAKYCWIYLIMLTAANLTHSHFLAFPPVAQSGEEGALCVRLRGQGERREERDRGGNSREGKSLGGWGDPGCSVGESRSCPGRVIQRKFLLTLWLAIAQHKLQGSKSWSCHAMVHTSKRLAQALQALQKQCLNHGKSGASNSDCRHGRMRGTLCVVGARKTISAALPWRCLREVQIKKDKVLWPYRKRILL